MTPAVIKSVVAKHYGVPLDALITSKAYAPSQARKMAMFTMRAVLAMSYPTIAAEFRQSDHTTALRAIRQMTARIEAMDGAQRDYEIIAAEISNAEIKKCSHCLRPFEDGVVAELKADFEALRLRFMVATRKVS